MITLTLETDTPLADMLGTKLAVERMLQTADLGELDRNAICRGSIESGGVVVGEWEYTPKRSGRVPVAALASARWEVRYRELAALCEAVQAAMPPGVLESTSEFAKRLYPDLRDMSKEQQRAVFKWLSVVATKMNAAHSFKMEEGKAYSKGKTVKKYLWGRKAQSPVDELV